MQIETLGQLRKHVLEVLIEIGIEREEANAEARLIIESATGLKLAAQMTFPDRYVAPESVVWAAEILSQRKKRKPIQFCLGETFFMGHRFLVDESVLIPRPETELLVEVCLDELANRPEASILDIGTGSGAIAVSLLLARSDTRVTAIDSSADALKVCIRNVTMNGVSERTTVVEFDWLARHPLSPTGSIPSTSSDRLFPGVPPTSLGSFDAIVSNPPYISWDDKASLKPEVLEWEPAQALFGPDRDGLGFYRSLAASSSIYLKQGGFLAVEVGFGQTDDIEKIFLDTGWVLGRKVKDLSGIDRVLVLRTGE